MNKQTESIDKASWQEMFEKEFSDVCNEHFSLKRTFKLLKFIQTLTDLAKAQERQFWSDRVKKLDGRIAELTKIKVTVKDEVFDD